MVRNKQKTAEPRWDESGRVAWVRHGEACKHDGVMLQELCILINWPWKERDNQVDKDRTPWTLECQRCTEEP